MAKFYGPIGFAITTDTNDPDNPGVWIEQITERNYMGDVLNDVVKREESGHLIDDVTVTNRISIVADPFANENFFSIRYVKWMGVLWKVVSVKVLYPRLILSMGDVYNGQTSGSS